MKKNLTKKLMLSVLTLAFAVVSLGASTFAWFTISPNADVEELTFEVTANSGIEIGVAAIGNTPDKYYISKLPKSAIWAAMNENEEEFTFNAVSYDDGLTGTNFEDFIEEPKFYNHITTKDTVNNPITGLEGYLAFELYVQADMEGYIKLNVPFLELVGSATAWGADLQYVDGNGKTIAKTTKVAYEVINAMRYAVIPTQNAGDDVEPIVYQQSTGEINSLGLSTSDKGSLYIYNEKYDGVDSDIPAPKSDDIAEASTNENNFFIFHVTPDTPYSFRIYLWVEGYDSECVNAIFAQKFTANISFEFASTADGFNG